MIIPPRIGPNARRSDHRARVRDPDWPSFVAGASAFLLIAGACLLLVANLAP